MSIPFEISTKPWFGPRKRAREVLSLRDKVLPPSEAITVVAGILGTAMSYVTRIRFIDFVNNDEGLFRYTIALLWVAPDAQARDLVYERAVAIVIATGWYPLPQGRTPLKPRDGKRI
jgi:hypothetical protein